MVKTKRESWQNKITLRVLSVFVLLCVIVAAMCFQFCLNLYDTIRDESRSYLQELSRRISNDVERIISDNFSTLSTVATSIEFLDVDTVSDIGPMLASQKMHLSYSNVMLVDSNGTAYGIDNSQVFMHLDNTVRSDIISGKQSISTTQIINNQEFILFSVPVHNVTLDGHNMVALVGSYDPTAFNQVLSMTSFDEQSYSQIVSKSGTVITRPTSAYAMKSGYNILTTLRDSSLGDEGMDKLQANLNSNVADMVSFSAEDTSRYLVYTPINHNDWFLFSFIPVQTVNNKSDMLMRTTLIISGIITVAFAGMVVTLIIIFSNNRRKLENLAYIDEVTGGHSMQKFQELATAEMAANPYKQYAIVYSNIEKFKVLNEQLGRQNCNKVLKTYHNHVAAALGDGEYIGRQFADNFCVLVEYQSNSLITARFTEWCMTAEQYVQNGVMPWGLPVLQYGVYVVQNPSMPIALMVDRAKLALRDTTWILDNKLSCGFYDDEVRRKLFREKQLEDRMKIALAGNEFRVFLQPKFHLPDETVGGAEALVRWESPEEGMIMPNEFIPLFEKNGFIIALDLWVFEEVCRTLERWKSEGLPLIKISVNCSRIHLKDLSFLSRYIDIVDRYDVDRKYLEIELTESAVLKDTDKLNRIIEAIRKNGFGCSMDDFGSGYSSLNMIQNIPVDTLKIDKIFFDQASDSSRSEAVIGSIVAMARALSMVTVAEGVEHRHQVEMLKRTGCDFIQGYVFARPMPIDKFEEMAFVQHQV